MSYVFNTYVNGIPCQCEVVSYSKEVPATWEQPSDPEQMDFQLLDRRGRRAVWLDRYIDKDVEMRMLCEFMEQRADYFMEPEYGE